MLLQLYLLLRFKASLCSTTAITKLVNWCPGLVKCEADLVKCEPDLLKREPDLVSVHEAELVNRETGLVKWGGGV